MFQVLLKKELQQVGGEYFIFLEITHVNISSKTLMLNKYAVHPLDFTPVIISGANYLKKCGAPWTFQNFFLLVICQSSLVFSFEKADVIAPAY